MRVLGIESSCDETGVAIYDTETGLRAHAVHTQIDLHAEYGGWCRNQRRATISGGLCR